MSKILVVDDEPKSVRLLVLRLQEAGHVLVSAGRVSEAKQRLERELFDLLITDVRLPDGSGIDVLKFAHELLPSLPVIVITAHGTIQAAVDAMKLGAVEFVQKPFELEAMSILVDKALEAASIRAEHTYLIGEVLEGEAEIELVGDSKSMQALRNLANKVAATRSTVLITGESGTGKELVARAIHEASTARRQPLIKVNCPGIPAQLFESELFGHMKGAFTGAYESRKGKFELAGRGNIFLDEIAEIPIDLQSKLLRVLEERQFTRIGGVNEVTVDARVIAATNKDLGVLIEQKLFRSDLYYRLNVFPIHLPPLRERAEDIPKLSMHLLCHVARSCGLVAEGITPEAMRILLAYHWPGNVRELRNILERALVLAGGGHVDTEFLPMELQEVPTPAADDGATFQLQVEGFKRQVLLDALDSAGWVKKDAAAQLGLSQRAFSHYVTRFELDRFRDR